jgi:hypothetical protein
MPWKFAIVKVQIWQWIGSVHKLNHIFKHYEGIANAFVWPLNSVPSAVSAMADNFGCRWLCCYFINLLLIFQNSEQNSEEGVLFYSWHISLTFIFLILILVFVVEIQHFRKEMHSPCHVFDWGLCRGCVRSNTFCAFLRFFLTDFYIIVIEVHK